MNPDEFNRRMKEQSFNKRVKLNDGSKVGLNRLDESEDEEDDTINDDLVQFDDPFIEEIVLQDDEKEENFDEPDLDFLNPQNDIEDDQNGDLLNDPVENLADEELDDKFEHPNKQTSQKPEIFLPFKHKKNSNEELTFDNSAYKIFHRFTTWWPTPSFDFIMNSNVPNSSQFPYDIKLVSCTQISHPQTGDRGINSITKKKEKYHFNVWKLSNMHKTQHDSADDETLDIEDDENFHEDPQFQCQKVLIHGPNNTRGNFDGNRIRVMPIDEKVKNSIAAVYCSNGRIMIYNVDNIVRKINEPSNMSLMNQSEKLLFTSMNVSDGFALDWSTKRKGCFAAGGSGKTIYVYDFNGSGGWKLNGTFDGHSKSVEDIQWSPVERNVFASCGCDGKVMIWDVRQKKYGMSFKVSDVDVNVISWNNLKNYYLLSGDDAGVLSVWDLRALYEMKQRNVNNPKSSARFAFHRKAITSVKWNPHNVSMFCSTSEDDVCVVWDLSVESTGMEDKLQDVPDQVMFLHMGQEMMKEANWHPQYKNLIVSAGFKSIHVFQPSNLV